VWTCTTLPTGFLGRGTEHHIPVSAIRDVRDDTIYLSIAKDLVQRVLLSIAAREADDRLSG
jgi:hypothetical protein